MILLHKKVFFSCLHKSKPQTQSLIEATTALLRPIYAKYCSWGAYFSAKDMAEWSIPEKILQKAVQTC